jgi:hypothetical protein
MVQVKDCFDDHFQRFFDHLRQDALGRIGDEYEFRRPIAQHVVQEAGRNDQQG